MNKNIKLNPVTSRPIALLYEPLVRCGFVLYFYLLYLFLKLYTYNFDIFELSKNSYLVLYFEVTEKIQVFSIYGIQLFLTTLFVLLYVNNHLSRGATLPKKIIRNTNLTGKVALVTGGYSGIGYEMVLQLLRWRCKVVILGRNKTKAAIAIKKLKDSGGFDEKNLYFIEVDLDNLISVKNAAKQMLIWFNRLDFLINNAGIWSSKFEKTPLNLESQFSSNYLGHFYLTKLLLELVVKSEGRILNVSSIALFKYNPNKDPIFEEKSTTSLVEKRYNTYYGRSKFYKVWFTHALQRRLKEENKKAIAVSLSPGVINTPLLWPIRNAHFYFIPKYVNLLVLKRPVDGAATALYLCALPASKLVPGAHYNERKLGFVSKFAHDYEREEKLWEFSEHLVKKLTKEKK